METVKLEDLDIQDFMKPSCKIKVGDIISMNNRPLDLMEVLDVTEGKDSEYYIKIKYRNRGIGPFERTYHSGFFTSENCKVQRKGKDVKL